MKHAEVGPDGARIRWVEIEGTSPTRVYLHGLGASSPAYYSHVAALSGHRSVLIDLLGFGLSDRPQNFDYSLDSHAAKLAVALEAMGLEGVDLVAHSMGGAVAIILASSRPDLVSRLVLVDSNLDPAIPSPTAIGSRRIAHYSEAEFLAGGFGEMPDMAGPEWWATMRLADPVALHRTAVSLVSGSMRKLLADLTIPRTFLIGDQEEPLERPEELTDAGVEIVVIPQAGHNIMLDNPEAFEAVLARHIG